MAGEVARITLQCDKFAPVAARRRLAEMPDHGWLLGDAMLVATELVTNAVRHSMCHEQDVLHVSIQHLAGRLRIAVRDPGRSGRTARISDGNGWSGGLGLKIVDQLATHWGSNRLVDGYEVWAELPMVAAGQPGESAPAAPGRQATSFNIGR